MHYCKNKATRYFTAVALWLRGGRTGERWVRLCVFLIALSTGVTHIAYAQSSSARSPALRLAMDAQALYLSTNVNIDLPSSVVFALEKGLAIQFVAKAKVSSQRWYWFDRNEADAVRSYKLSYVPLTRKWRVQIGGAQISSLSPAISFDSKEAALSAMQRINQWQIAKASDLKPDEVYTAEFSYELDIASLPRPIQIGVIGENDWAVSVRRSLRFVPRSLQ